MKFYIEDRLPISNSRDAFYDKKNINDRKN